MWRCISQHLRCMSLCILSWRMTLNIYNTHFELIASSRNALSSMQHLGTRHCQQSQLLSGNSEKFLVANSDNCLLATWTISYWQQRQLLIDNSDNWLLPMATIACWQQASCVIVLETTLTVYKGLLNWQHMYPKNLDCQLIENYL